ncbi:hypothetical protein [Rhizobium sp. LjRoot258]|uniref:hypothetical protein n=1 Tax=Rhizobium sp. LjRoot258 TaxID=3342299 RepID=UPI003ECE2ED1
MMPIAVNLTAIWHQIAAKAVVTILIKTLADEDEEPMAGDAIRFSSETKTLALR